MPRIKVERHVALHRPKPPRFPGPLRSLHLTPVDHIVSGWGQMQGTPSFGQGSEAASHAAIAALFAARLSSIATWIGLKLE